MSKMKNNLSSYFDISEMHLQLQARFESVCSRVPWAAWHGSDGMQGANSSLLSPFFSVDKKVSWLSFNFLLLCSPCCSCPSWAGQTDRTLKDVQLLWPTQETTVSTVYRKDGNSWPWSTVEYLQTLDLGLGSKQITSFLALWQQFISKHPDTNLLSRRARAKQTEFLPCQWSLSTS